jgi:lipopolysaccharide/colanic/teichoic acid biosynthesis glycosyltransferase
MPSLFTRIFGDRPGKAGELLSADQFGKVLERERMRADRAGSPLSLIAFTRPTAAGNLGKMSAVLNSRLRATDVAGQLDDGRVGALLPNTAEDAAWCVANEVRQAFDSPDEALYCEVYTHPFQPPVPEARTQEGPDHDTAASTSKPLTQVLLQPLPCWKRALDVLGASVGLLVFSPLMAAAAIGIKLTSPGPVLFQQRRTGLGGQPFTIYKLRTMCLNAEEKKQALQSQNEQDGPAFKIKNDPRVTTLGRYLRITCVDELPQLFNVLLGDMTLVGPRPLPVDESQRCQDWEQRRLEVTPGLTCIWQAAGRRERVSFSDWMRMDLRYMKVRSVRKDLLLLWRTFINVVSHRGSH